MKNTEKIKFEDLPKIVVTLEPDQSREDTVERDEWVNQKDKENYDRIVDEAITRTNNYANWKKKMSDGKDRNG